MISPHTPSSASPQKAGGDPRTPSRAPASARSNDHIQTLASAYSRHGGVVSAEEVALLMRRQCEQPVSQLARWIVGSKIVHFAVHSQTWVPLFQFHLDDMSIRPAISTLLGELGAVLDGDELATWFAAPNDWLSGASPLETIEADFPAVLEAARADRFVVAG